MFAMLGTSASTVISYMNSQAAAASKAQSASTSEGSSTTSVDATA
jgi:hypothetical protein